MGLETEKCPVCGTSVKKENLKGHLGRVHSKRPGSTAERQVVVKSAPVFRSHKKRNALIGAGIGVTLVALLVLGVYFSHVPTMGTYQGPAAAGTQAEFNYLSQQSTDGCRDLGNEIANVNWINSLADDTYIQGSCCTPMAWTDYSSQIPGLTNYSSISIITPDPYNVLAKTAKAMVASVDLRLSASQQSTSNSAMNMTADKGPCCCMCWAGYAHEGQAKALIVQYGYDAQQLAAVLNFEDCCGGPGQMNM